MTRVFRANPEQRRALDEATESHNEDMRRITKEQFIRDFLAFSGRIAPEGNGYWVPIGNSLDVLHSHNTSNLMALPTDASPQRGVEIEVYAAVIEKAKRRGNHDKPLGMVAIAADVNLGLIVNSTFPELTGQETVLRVTSMPPAVYYKHGDTDLAPINPGTEVWAEMIELANTLTTHEAELLSPTV